MLAATSSEQQPADAPAAAQQQEAAGGMGAGGMGAGEACDDESDSRQHDLAAAFGGEAAALGKEGWWLVVESLRPASSLNLPKAAKDAEPVHNSMVGRQALSPSLDDPQWCADIEFDAPTSPGEYKVIVHVRSSTMIGACRAAPRTRRRLSLPPPFLCRPAR